eukprot:7628746-Heterocapsa_arctica.AAC.1
MVLQETGLKHTTISRIVRDYTGPETKISMILNDRSAQNFSEQTIIEDDGRQLIGETKQEAVHTRVSGTSLAEQNDQRCSR